MATAFCYAEASEAKQQKTVCAKGDFAAVFIYKTQEETEETPAVLTVTLCSS